MKTRRTYCRPCPWCGDMLDPGEVCACRVQAHKQSDALPAATDRAPEPPANRYHHITPDADLSIWNDIALQAEKVMERTGLSLDVLMEAMFGILFTEGEEAALAYLNERRKNHE